MISYTCMQREREREHMRELREAGKGKRIWEKEKY
jgi:hypothetical protein